MKITKISDFVASIKENKDLKQIINSPSQLGFAFFDSIHYAPKDDWSQVIRDDKLLMQRDYLLAVENSSEESHQHRYVLIYKGKLPVAAAIFNIIEIAGEDFGSSKEQKNSSTKKMVNKFKDKATLRILICGNVHLSGNHGFYYTQELDPKEAYHALAEAVYRIKQSEKRRGKIHIQLIKDFYSEEFEKSNYLKNFKYRKFEVDPNMIVHIKDSWKTFEDYLDDMKGKYRKRAVSVIKRGQKLERRILSSIEIKEQQQRINQLYENVAEKAKFRIVNIPAEYFYYLNESLKENFEFLGYFLDGLLVGFTCSIFWDDNCEGHTIGLDYEFNNEYSIYQNILYDDIKMAIQHSKKKVIFGRTALEIKSGVGAEAAEMQCFVRHPNAITNKLLKPVFRHIKTSEWTPRSPFK